jgi:hypothetical protein
MVILLDTNISSMSMVDIGYRFIHCFIYMSMVIVGRATDIIIIYMSMLFPTIYTMAYDTGEMIYFYLSMVIISISIYHLFLLTNQRIGYPFFCQVFLFSS